MIRQVLPAMEEAKEGVGEDGQSGQRKGDATMDTAKERVRKQKKVGEREPRKVK